MSLPILKVTHQPTQDDLVRFFHRTELHWTRHIAEESTFDFGAVFTNPDLPNAHRANRILDAIVPPGMSPTEVFDQAQRHYEQARVACRRWFLAPGAPAAQTEPLADHLKSRGFTPTSFDILYLGHQPTSPIREIAGLTIIPARASYKHVRQLADEWAAEYKTPELAEASMLHLDGDHNDAIFALKDGKPAAMASVLAVGDIGAIEAVFVSAPFRNQGVGRTIMSRAMEICARSLFKHVFVGADPANKPAVALYSRFGFRPIGRYISYALP